MQSLRPPAVPAACAFSLGLVLSALSPAAHAQTAPPPPGTDPAARLSPVIVTATRVETRVDDTIAEVSVIPRTELERSGGLSLAQILAQQPGIQASSLGGLGQPGAVFVRGMESRHTLLMVDGIRLGFVDAGQPTINNLPLSSLDRIEVVRGPLSALYGADAAAGVVQLLTARPAEPGLRGQVGVTLGALQHRQTDASVSWKGGPLDGSVQVSGVSSRGFSATNPRNDGITGYCVDALCSAFLLKLIHDPDRDSFRQRSGVLRLGWQLSEHWRADLLSLESIADVGFDDGDGVDARLRLTSAVQRLQLSGQPAPGMKTRITVGESRDDYQTLASFYLRGPGNPTGASSAPLVNRQRQLGIEQQFDTPHGTLVALAERLEQQVDLPPESPAYSTNQRTVDGIGLGFDGQAGRVAWQAALRHDRNSTWGHQNTGSLGWSLPIGPQWRLGASLGSSFVMPSFQLLYYPGYSNPDLRPETGRHTEVFAQWRPTAAHSLRLAWVDNRMQDLIISPAPTYQPVNVAQARIDGLTLNWRAQWGPLRSQLNIDRLDPRDTLTGLQLARRAPTALRLSLERPVQAWTLAGRLTAWSHRFNDADNTERLPGFATVDLRAERSLARDWTIALRLDNLTDRIYETARGYNQPRRGAFVTLGWQLR
jgi:vitamin B12 transporter